MARIKLGPMVTDISGSVGGATFQRSRFGITMRSKPLPIRSQTIPQYNVRNIIRSLQNSWQSLTDAQRLQWDRFIDFSGQGILRDRSVKLSGQTLFLKYQFHRLLALRPLLTTIAYTPMPAYIIPDFLIRTGGVLYLHFPGAIESTSYFFTFKLTNTRTPSQAFSFQGLRYMDVDYATQGVFYLTNPYLAAFGILPTVGDWHHYSITYWSYVSPVITGVFTGKIQSIPPI